MIPIEKVKEIISRHEFLEKQLSSNEVDKKILPNYQKNIPI